MPRKSTAEILVYLAMIVLALVALALVSTSPHFLLDNRPVYQAF